MGMITIRLKEKVLSKTVKEFTSLKKKPSVFWQILLKKGKKILEEYYNNIFEDFHKYISVAPLIFPFNIERITKILNCIYREELSDISEISKITGLDEGLVHRYVSDLKKAKIILERPINKNSKKGLRQVDFSKTELLIRFDENDLNRIIDHYKNAKNEIKDAEKIFVKNKKRIAELSARVKPFKVRDPPPIHDEARDELEKLVIKKKKK